MQIVYVIKWISHSVVESRESIDPQSHGSEKTVIMCFRVKTCWKSIYLSCIRLGNILDYLIKDRQFVLYLNVSAVQEPESYGYRIYQANRNILCNLKYLNVEVPENPNLFCWQWIYGILPHGTMHRIWNSSIMHVGLVTNMSFNICDLKATAFPKQLA